ncbi:MAG: PilX N-terminal domain-containing pilus assembly protein [Gammaproteobacteria bacterium]
MKQHDCRNSPLRNQSGSALMVSLVFLVIMTIIGIASMNTAVMENVMASNSQFQASSLANAEFIIGSGEDDIETIVADAQALAFETSDDHYYLADDVDPAVNDWTFKHATTTLGSYVVEYAGKHPIPGESAEMGAGTAGSFVYLFLVSAQSEANKGARRNVQTVYVTQNAP